MSDDQLYDLVIEWDRRRQLGEELPVEVLCADHPELLEDVKTRIASVKGTDWMFQWDEQEDDEEQGKFLSLPDFAKAAADAYSVPSSVTLEQFTSGLVESGLIGGDEIAQIAASDASELAAKLFRAKKLTAYQAEQICKGNTKHLVLGNYVILSEIGAGGMGRVFKAHHTRMDRLVALKVLPEKALDSPTAVERFQREAKAAAKLEHPNIVTAYDADECDGTHFLVMQYVDGDNLSSLVRKNGPMPVAGAVQCIIQAATGLQYAHSQGLIHRDIKPGNLLLDHNGTAKVLDMGLARFERSAGVDLTDATEEELTQDGAVLGTVDYMAPEQAKDTKHADSRADVYSLGCSLYYLLTGKSPYGGGTIVARMLSHREAEIPSLCAARDDIPEQLDACFRKMVAKNPDDRYQTMTALLEDLESIANKFPDDCPAFSDAGDASADATVTESEEDIQSKETSASRAAETLASDDIFPRVAPAVASSGSRNLLGRPRILAGGAVAVLLLAAFAYWLFGVVLRIETDGGIVQIETNVPDVEVYVDDQKVVYVTDPTDKRKIKVEVKPNAQTLKVTKDGFEADVKEFRLRTMKGPVKVTFEPFTKEKEIAPPADTADRRKPAKVAARPQPTDVVRPSATAAAAWEPGPTEDVLPGLVARPAKLPGVVRWQMETVTPRTSVLSVAYSPNGQSIACGTRGGHVRIYDANTLRLERLLLGHQGRVESVTWSPDGKWLASGGKYDKTIRVWAPDGRAVAAFPGPGAGINAVAWSSDSRWIAAGGSGGFGLWRRDGSPELVMKPPSSNVTAVAWSPDGTWLTIGCNDGTIRLYQPDGTAGLVLQAHASVVNSLAWSPDGRWLASVGTNDKDVRLWKPDGTPGPMLKGHERAVNSVAWNRDGVLIASSVNLLETRQSDEWRGEVIDLNNWFGGGYVFSVAWSPDGKRFAAGGERGLLAGSMEDKINLPRSSDQVRDIAFSPTGKELANATTESWLWSMDGRAGTLLEGFHGKCVAYSPDGEWLALMKSGGTIGLQNSDGIMGAEFKTQSPWDFEWSPDGRRLASAHADGTVRIWDRDGTLRSVLEGHVGKVTRVTWSPDGTRLASARPGRTIRIWKAEGTLETMIDIPYAPERVPLAWSPDGKWLAHSGVSADGSIQLSEPNGNPGRVFRDAKAYSLAWAPDSQRLVFGGYDGPVRIFGVDGTLERVLPGHKTAVWAIAWSGDGKRIASGSDDQTVTLWDADTAEPLWTTVFLPGEGQAASFTPAGQLMHLSTDAESELVYVVERTPGKQELLTYEEFHEQFGEDLK